MSEAVVEYILKKDGEVQLVPLTFVQDEDSGFTMGLDGCEFLSINEMVEDILANRISEEDKEWLIKPEKDMFDILGEIEFSRWIRNAYGLWLPEHPVTNPEDHEGPFHPDQYSHTALDKIKEILSTMKEADNAIAKGKEALDAFEEGKKVL